MSTTKLEYSVKFVIEVDVIDEADLPYGEAAQLAWDTLLELYNDPNNTGLSAEVRKRGRPGVQVWNIAIGRLPLRED